MRAASIGLFMAAVGTAVLVVAVDAWGLFGACVLVMLVAIDIYRDGGAS